MAVGLTATRTASSRRQLLIYRNCWCAPALSKQLLWAIPRAGCIDTAVLRVLPRCSQTWLSEKQLPSDLATEILLERCNRFAKDPPPEQWDGVDKVTSKKF